MTRDQHGFTVVEMLVAMAVIGIFLAAAMPLLGSTIVRSTDVEQRVALQTEVRAAVDQLARDLRQAYSGDTTSPIENIGASQLTFLTPDRAEPFHLRRVAYRVNGTVLERATAFSIDTDGVPWVIPALGAWTPVVGSVSNPVVFTFMDENGNATVNPALVRSIGISVNVTAARTSGATRFTYRTQVHLRAVQ